MSQLLKIKKVETYKSLLLIKKMIINMANSNKKGSFFRNKSCLTNCMVYSYNLTIIPY